MKEDENEHSFMLSDNGDNNIPYLTSLNNSIIDNYDSNFISNI